MPRALIALGSNLGDRGQLLRSAVESLRAEPGVAVEAVSPIAITDPVGGPPGQPQFLNGVLRLSTELSPWALLALCQRIESEHDRVRVQRWGPRTLDLDIIDYDGAVLDDPELSIPHPRAHERAFVLFPWALLEPRAELAGRSVAELAGQAQDAQGIRAQTFRLEDAPGEDETAQDRDSENPGADSTGMTPS